MPHTCTGMASPPAHLTGGALQAHDKRFAPGDVVLLHGLEARPELNGCYGCVAAGRLANGRFRLRLAAGDVVDDVAPRSIVSVSVHARKSSSP